MTDDAEVSPGALVRTLLGIGPRETHATGRCSDLTDEQLSQLVDTSRPPTLTSRSPSTSPRSH
jgi:hypothetical protein